MRHLYRALTSVAVLTVLFVSGFNPALAVPETPNPVIPVVDDSNTLNADELIMIGNAANAEDNEARVFTYIVAEVPAEHDDIESASEEVFNAWGLERNNGVLIYIAKADGEINIQVADTLMESLTAEDMDRILNESIIPSLREDNYAGGIVSGIREINSTIDENTSSSILPAGFSTSALTPYLKYAGIIVGIIFGLFVLFKVLGLLLKSTSASSQSDKGGLEQNLKNELNSVRKENERLLSQIKSLKARSTDSYSQSTGFSGKVDESRLKEDLMRIYESNPNNFFSIFDEISGIDKSVSENINSGNDYTSSNNSTYDNSRMLDSFSSSSSYDNSYSSSYTNSSYDSGYRSSYGSDFNYSGSDNGR